MDTLENNWRQYEILVDLYKFYIYANIITNSVIFFIIGSTSTYAIINYSKDARLFVILIFAFMVSSLSGFACLRYYKPSRELSKEIQQLASKIKVGLAPHTFILPWILQSLIAMYSFISLGLILAGILLIKDVSFLTK